MYAGHAGVALAAHALRTRVPLWILLLLAYGPDWIEWAFGAKLDKHRAATLASHTIASVAICALLAAAVTGAITRRARDAVVVAVVYASHYPLDLLTGRKPTWPGGPVLRVWLFDGTAMNFALEAAFLTAAAVVYARTLPPSRRIGAALVVAGLMALHAGSQILMSVGA